MMKKQRGFLALLAIALIVIIGFLGMIIMYMFVGSTNSSINFLQASKAFYIAEGGLEEATRYLLTPVLSGAATRISCNNINTNANLITTTLGDGEFSVTSTGSFYPTAATTLNGALTATATSITVLSTTNYQSDGRIMIDKELINYASIDSTHFLGVTRGVDGTTATTHTTGTTVGQYQCNLSATGGVPNLTSPLNQRVVEENVQLQEAWAGGFVNGGNYQFKRWNRPTELLWNNFTAAGTRDINEISMLSYSDGWAALGLSAGGSGTTNITLHWNGTSWAAGPVTPVTTTWRTVHCNASNDCHMGGDAVSSRATLIEYNGTSWSRGATTGFANNNINSLRCSANNFCEAVGTGTSTSTRVFYNWNGTSPWKTQNVNGLFNTSFPFNSVFCNSSTNCWAVGANATFARWTGSWAAVATGLPAAQYNAVFCNSATDCWAVGNINSSRDLIVHYNGSTWSRDASAPTPTSNLLYVTCANANDCWAVGSTSSGGIVHYDGTSWTTYATSLPSGIQLNTVSIISPNSHPQSAWMEKFS